MQISIYISYKETLENIRENSIYKSMHENTNSVWINI